MRSYLLRTVIPALVIGGQTLLPAMLNAQAARADSSQHAHPGERIEGAAAFPWDIVSPLCLEMEMGWLRRPDDELGSITYCEVDRDAFPEVTAGVWRWARFSYAATRPSAPDTVRQERLVLMFRPGGADGFVPVWQDQSDVDGPRLEPPRAARLGEALFLVHRRCLRGTGGCMDWPYRLGGGTVEPLRRVYLDELRAGIPQEWGLWKGVYLDPSDSTAEAPVYVSGDANCCPSFHASGRVRVSGDAVRLDSLEIVPDTSSPAWLVVDSIDGVGHIRGTTSVESLVRAYGAAAVQPGAISIGEGYCIAGARVFPDTPMEIEVGWVDSTGSRPAFVRISQREGPWRTPAGVAVGTPLARLEQIRGGPLVFSGFGWDYGGSLSWSEGHGELGLALTPDREGLTALQSTDPRVDELFGDRPVSSDHPLVPGLGLTVDMIFIDFAEPARDQIRFCG